MTSTVCPTCKGAGTLTTATVCAPSYWGTFTSTCEHGSLTAHPTESTAPCSQCAGTGVTR